MERRALAVRRTVVVVLFLHPPESLSPAPLRSELHFLLYHSHPGQILKPSNSGYSLFAPTACGWPGSGRSRLAPVKSDWYPSVWPIAEKRIVLCVTTTTVGRESKSSRGCRIDFLCLLACLPACLIEQHHVMTDQVRAN